MITEGKMVFRTTSPLLADTPAAILRECPVSVILRETPYIYDALDAASYVDNGAVSPYTFSGWGREAVRVVMSERARHSNAKDKERNLLRDARASHG